MSSILGKRPLSSYSNDCFVGKRQKTLATLVDEYAWDYEPEELIDAAKPNMRSPAYPHYNIRVEKVMGAVSGKPTWSHILFHFESLWGACSHRSFDSLTDKFHQQEVDYLHPGTKLLLSKTLLRDIKLIHTQFVPKIKEYFASISGAVHVAVNGWTSPTSESYLGVSLFGAYLAGKIASCLQQYGLENWILAACLDNASNNLRLVQNLEQLVPHFHGEQSYVQCLAHVINLMAKAFMSPFNCPSQRARKVLEQAPWPTSSAAKHATHGFLQAQQASNTGDNGELDNSEAADIDKAKFEHNTLVVQAVVYQALEQLLSMHSLVLTAQDLCDAQAIMTTVANLACRVDESPMLKTKFQEYLLSYPELKESTWCSLACCMATCWNSDCKALDNYLYLWHPVKKLTNNPGLNLHHLALATTQHELALELNKALEVSFNFSL
ncbi:protein dimerization, partial [Rhizoctonia solani]